MNFLNYVTEENYFLIMQNENWQGNNTNKRN